MGRMFRLFVKYRGLIFLVLAIVVSLVIAIIASKQINVSYLGQQDRSRGIRNNNAGNLKMGSDDWRGSIPHDQNTDGNFEQFKSWKWGVRAMIIVVRDAYMGRHDLHTIREIIGRYAPQEKVEGEERSYFVNLRKLTGFEPDAVLGNDKETLRILIKAMGEIETGEKEIITDSQFNEAWRLSLMP